MDTADKRVKLAEHGDGFVNVGWYSPVGDGSSDDSLAFQAAIADANLMGCNVRIPPGSFAIKQKLLLRPTTFVSNFGTVPKFVGAGVGCTTIYTGVDNDALFEISAQAVYSGFKGVLGCGFADFTIRKLGSTAGTTAIKMRGAYHCTIEKLHISGMSANGIEITTAAGDLDSNIMPVIRDVRIDNCAGWGIKADADPGHNESSFLGMEGVFIQACGTASAATPPPSGGMIWKGQILSAKNCAFAGGNENVGLYIPGQAGLGSNVHLQDVTFENCKKRSIYCTGVNGFRAISCQFYNNDTFLATNGVEFDGSSYLVRNVLFDGSTIRATIGNNALTAFKISGSNAEPDTCRVKNTDWQNYDFTGQVRFDGWKFDAIPMQVPLVRINNQIARLTSALSSVGNVMPLRAVRALAGNAIISTTGEWKPTSISTLALAPTTGSGPEVPATLLEGGSIAPSTRYNCYLWNDVGVVKISLSATDPVVDTVGGYLVRTGYPYQLWVGAITTDASAAPNIRFSHVETHGNGRTGSTVYDPPNLADGAGTTTTVAVKGAVLGDYAMASFSVALQDVTLTAWVSAANTVSVRLQNETGGALDLASGILRACVRRA